MRLVLPFLALVALAGACTSANSATAPPGEITVVATTTQMQDLVRNVGGRRVHVVGILRPKFFDPHDFEPTPSTAVALGNAKLVVESGVGLDAWADELVASAAEGTPVFVASAGLPIRQGTRRSPQATRTGGTTRRSSNGRQRRWGGGWDKSIRPNGEPMHGTPPTTSPGFG